MSFARSLLDKPREECGVCAAFSIRQENVAQILFFALQALQHRGQESAGISLVESKVDPKVELKTALGTASKNKKIIKTHKSMGLVEDVFPPEKLSAMHSFLGIGHVRYSTVGTSNILAAQPIQTETSAGCISIAHNGTISNAKVLREFLEDMGDVFSSDADSEIILTLIKHKAKHGFPKAIEHAVPMLQGSYSMVMLAEDKIMGMKDPYGIRPLCVGLINDDTYMLASESCALDAVGATYIREIECGEIVTIDKHGLHSYKFTEKNMSFPCSFEQIYFSRPDSILGNTNVYNTRNKMGQLLYNQAPLEADIVIGVPDSGVPAATGFSEVSGIPLEMGLVKNRYMTRSFIHPTKEMREQIVRKKFNVITNIVQNKRVVIVDDSLVRGTTSTILIQMLREAGARQVHFRSAAPPVRFLCYFGIDISKRKELVANKTSIEELGKSIGADSLVFLSLENLSKALNALPHCMGCFSGVYPTYAPSDALEN